MHDGAGAFGDCRRDKIIAFLNQSLLAPIDLVFERRGPTRRKRARNHCDREL